MIISCESCGSKFRLEPNQLKKPTNKVRCSHCKHIFFVSKETPVGGQEEDDLLTSFDTDDTNEKNVKADTSKGKPFPPPPGKAGIPARTKKKQSMAKVLTMGILILALLGGIAFWLLSTKTLQHISERKDSPKSTELLTQPSVSILESTHAYFLENLPSGQVFIVEGEAVNESPQPVSFVLLEGKLYTTRNAVALSQRCYAGNVISQEDLPNLPITEIQDRMMNREGANLINVQIPQGGRVPFMIVFHNLPELNTLSDYGVEVLSAKID